MITSLRSDTTIDLIISNIIPEATENVALPYRCSDHFPIVTKFLEYSTTNNKRLVPRTYWNLFPFFLTVLQVELSESLNKNSNGTSDTFGWFQTLERLLSALKSRITNWEDFIANVASPDPSAFWSTVKKLNKKKSTNF